MTDLESFRPRMSQVFVDGSASTTLEAVTLGRPLGGANVTRIVELDTGVIRVEREGRAAVRIYAEGHGVERDAAPLPVTAMTGAPTSPEAARASQAIPAKLGGGEQKGRRR